MVNIRTATPQINRFGTGAERGQSSEWDAVIVEILRVLWTRCDLRQDYPFTPFQGASGE
jgi:hypothetical protein